MKAIELTQYQKDKLMEMIEKLFPEYSGKSGSISLEIPFVSYGNKYERMNGNHCFVMGFKDYNDNLADPDLYIHWFEFCIKHLILKLSDSIQSTVDLRMLFCEFPNPVDYLYAHFEKLNK